MAKAITETELSLLCKLWQQPSATVKELAQWQYGSISPGLLATVRKLLDRLEAEKCVACDRTQWPHYYRAVLKREDLLDKRLQELADELFEGDKVSLLIHIVRSQTLTSTDRKIFRKLLE